MWACPRPGCAALAALLLAPGCGGRPSEPKPVATLASSPEAAAAFDAIRRAWGDENPTNGAALRAMIEGFLTRFPHDSLVPLARIALALSAMQTQDFAQADAQLKLTQGVPPGTARDLWTVARARSLRLRGDPEAALGLLRPLVGKGVDPLGRTLFAEELTLTALATHREYEAISYMDAWLRATADEDKAAAVERVSAMVEHLPKDVLVGALQAMRAQRASLGYGVDIERILSDQLVQIATTSGDAALARILLDTDAGVPISENAGAALGELATSGRGLNRVAGRTVGLLLPTESPGLRDESADVLRGVMWALGLPRGVRKSPTRSAIAEDGGTAKESTAGACAPLESAPELGEPHASEGMRLATRNDAGSADRTEVSLDELAGEGAAIVIAGLDAKTATRALRWGEDHGVAVIALVAPDEDHARDSGRAFAFLLGERRDDVASVLARAAPMLATETVIPVVDSSEVSSYPPAGGKGLGLTLGPPVSCDTPATRAGDPRFPITQWDRDRAHAWLVTGSPGCAKDVIAELSDARAIGIVAMTLEATTLATHPAGLRVVSAQAGVVPASPPGDPRAEEVLRFSAILGSVGWWVALGRDAATLARIAVRDLPTDDVSDPPSVVTRRVTARDRLASARAPLWTTEKSGWGGGRLMKRTVCSITQSGKE
jgi:hypothetical protein